MMKAGWTHDSKRPKRNRTTMREAKSWDAAEHVTTAPQHATLESVSLESMVIPQLYLLDGKKLGDR